MGRYYGARSKFVYYNSLAVTHPDLHDKLMCDLAKYHAEHAQKMQKIAI
jgi:hypothetical protein